MENRYLFRAKRIDNGEWVEGYYTYYPHGFTSEDKMEHVIRDTVTSGDCNKLYFVDPSTICQCTGINDKNGKLIWENDVITISAYDYLEPTDDYTGIVCYSEKDVCWCLKDFENEEKIIPICECYGEYVTEITKLGNIFDNPELLEQEG